QYLCAPCPVTGERCDRYRPLGDGVSGGTASSDEPRGLLTALQEASRPATAAVPTALPIERCTPAAALWRAHRNGGRSNRLFRSESPGTLFPSFLWRHTRSLPDRDVGLYYLAPRASHTF